MNSLAEAFRENGSSGHTYRLTRRGEGSVDMEDLSDVRFYAVWRGHLAIAGALEPRFDESTGQIRKLGLLKVNPELTPEELHEIHEAGFQTESHPAI